MTRRYGKMAGLIRNDFVGSGMSIKKLAEESDSHYASIYGFIVLGRDLKLSTAERVCEVLGLELRRIRSGAKGRGKGS